MDVNAERYSAPLPMGLNMGYCWVELHAGSSRIMRKPIPRLCQHLGIGQDIVVKLLAETKEKLRDWFVGMTEDELQLGPYQSQVERWQWVKIHQVFLATTEYATWEKRIIADLITPKHRTDHHASNRRWVSLNRLEANCKTPRPKARRGRGTRRREIIDLLVKLIKRGLITGGDLGPGRRGWIALDLDRVSQIGVADSPQSPSRNGIDQPDGHPHLDHRAPPFESQGTPI